MKLNDFQQKAVEEFEHDLLLMAGAGTGKTRVLTEKYLRLIQEKGYDPRRIVAITFTQKAALEMRGRIREAINSRHVEASDLRTKLFWGQHLKYLEDAYIGTFHGLCGNILRENPIATGIIAGMRVLSEGEERILLATAAERACVNASHQGTPEERELFWKAIIQFGLNFFLEQLKSYFPKIRESGLPVTEWVQVHDFKLQMPAEDGFSKLKEAVRDILESDARRKATENSQRILRELEERFNELTPGSGDGFTECASKLKQLKGLLPKNMGRELRPYIDEIHESADQLLLQESHTEYEKWTGCISRFFELISDAYSEEKRLQNALDFTDLQLKTRDLLRDKPEIREEIQNRYDYFLVDEFQDTNLLQLEIVRLLTGNRHSKGRLFVVGDAKQSIYRFRGAQVQVVKDLEEELKKRNGQVLPLVENYRCHPAIIDMINHISEVTFRDDEITYQGLIASKNEIRSDISHMCILTNPTNSRTDEAKKLADYIHYIVNVEQPPIDIGDGKSRKLGYGDIALLLRAMTHVEEYTAAFESRGIPFTLGSGSGYYGLQEVLDQLNLIRLIHNSRDALALLALLRSPYAGLSDADLFWLAEDRNDLLDTFYKGDQMPHGLSKSSWQRVLRLRRWVAEVQESRSYLSVTEIIRRAMNDLGYIHVIAAFPGAERSLANLDKLLHKADAYAEVNGRYGIGEFIEYIGNMVAAQEREGEANLESEGGDAVQLMTIHASKGLEFPLVVLADLEHKLIQPEHSSVVYHPQIGLGFKIPDGSGNLVEPPVRNKIKELNQREERSELRRLLYVALTRARDYLVLSGLTEESAADPAGKSWGDWLRASFPMNALQNESFQLAGRDVQVIGTIPEADLTLSEQQSEWWNVIRPFDETAATLENIAPSILVQDMKPMKFSVTSLLTYLECPRNYYLIYRLGLQSENDSDSETSEGGSLFGALIGRIVHALCSANVQDPNEVKLRIARGLSGIPRNERHSAEEAIGKLYEKYRQSPYGQETKRGYSEYPFTINTRSNSRIHGIIDRLVLREDGYHLVDFKTNHIQDREHLTKLAEHYKTQILTYAYAVRKIFKAIPQSELLFLDCGSLYPFSITDVILDEWGHVLDHSTELMSRGRNAEDFPASTDCAQCSRRAFCPI